ncbi:MAG: mandelate racemase/muconate lactonizing enzyme family protein, partial [Paracoccaceae bacterium]
SALSAGYQALKLKIGFNTSADIQNIKSLRALLGKNGHLMVDANQAWGLDEAQGIIRSISDYGLSWLEEPIHADRPINEWQSLSASSNIPLAAGENVIGEQHFDSLIESSYLSIVQPDLAKWGGLTKIVPVAKKIIAAGKRYCPHYLGGGVGLLASAHALAAAGGDGILEVDINQNPLRTIFVEPVSGVLKLGDGPGLGIDIDLDAVAKYKVQ